MSGLTLSGGLGLVSLGIVLGSNPVEAGFVWPTKPPSPPRFELDNPSELPLQATEHYVEVVGPVAYVRLVQVYKNTGSQALDANYVFPGSTRSAVSSLVMRVGKRTIHAELKQKDEARETFEQAKRDGYRASLLEQKRPNVFAMALTNLGPGETVEVELGYTELLEPEEGRYELVLPGVVAPRFGGEPEGIGAERLTVSVAKAAKWTAEVKIQDGLNISEVSSPTYTGIEPAVDASGGISVKVQSKGDKDFVLRWRVIADRQAEAGLVLYEGEDERFFMMTVAPPKVVPEAAAPAREIVFILDVSGSMRGYPLDVAKGVMKTSLEALRPEDRFNILFFAGGGWRLSEKPLPATPENVKTALGTVSEQRGGGGTQLVEALNSVASLPRAEGLARTIVVVTDGLVSFEKSAFAKVRKKLSDSTLFTLGIGFNVNRMLVEGLARAGGGTSHVAYDRSSANEEAKRLGEAIRQPVLTDIQLKIEGLDAYDLEPPTIPDLYADRPIVVVGKYRGAAKGQLKLSAQARNHPFENILKVAAVNVRKVGSSSTGVKEERGEDSTATDASYLATVNPLRILWARRKLQRVADDRALVDGGADQKTITKIGLRYGLLTEYTSFVAVDSKGGKVAGPKQVIEQPGPMPHGMSHFKEYSRLSSGSKRKLVPSVGRGRRGGRPPQPMVMVEAEAARDDVAAPRAEAAGAVAKKDNVLADVSKKHQHPAVVEVLPPLVQGQLTSGEVKLAVEKILPELQKLADSLLVAELDTIADRRITFGLKLGAQGQVVEVVVISDALGSATLRDAWKKVFIGLKLSRGGATDVVRVPLAIKPSIK
ncbi:MAG: VWA domain-containing protein [Myxococcales bacterium]|nr:VWA domain-containing protein [Myxococcales bacterium]